MIDVYDFTATPDEYGNMRYDFYFTATPDELKYIKQYIDNVEADTWNRINKCPLKR